MRGMHWLTLFLGFVGGIIFGPWVMGLFGRGRTA